LYHEEPLILKVFPIDPHDESLGSTNEQYFQLKVNKKTNPIVLFLRDKKN